VNALDRVIATVLSGLFLFGSCALLPRPDVTVVGASDPAANGIGGALVVGKIEVNRQSLSLEIKRDLEVFLPTLSFAGMTDGPGIVVDLVLTEREVVRNFTTFNALMLMMRFSPKGSKDAAARSVIMTMESKDSVCSPHVLRRHVRTCMKMAETQLMRTPGRETGDAR